jgi:hypothetical protein
MMSPVSLSSKYSEKSLQVCTDVSIRVLIACVMEEHSCALGRQSGYMYSSYF